MNYFPAFKRLGINLEHSPVELEVDLTLSSNKDFLLQGKMDACRAAVIWEPVLFCNQFKSGPFKKYFKNKWRGN